MSDSLSEMNSSRYINYQDINNPQSYPEIGSPSVGPYISTSLSQNLPYNDQIYGTMVCYNCLSVLLIRKDWNYTRCGECQKIKRIPQKNNIPLQHSSYNIYNNNNNFYEDSLNNNKNELIGDVPYVYGLVNCPYCSTENKITKDAKRITCYNCANSFNVNDSSNYIKETVTKVIHTGEYIPVYQNQDNHCNCKSNSLQLLMLDKILQELKDKKRPQIAYPTIFADPFGFYYRDLIGYGPYNNRYGDNNVRKIRIPVSYSQPKIKKNEPDGFRITIKKRNKDNNGDNKLSKSDSSVFEKVFFTNKLKDDFNKKKYE